jgi:citrate synthase
MTGFSTRVSSVTEGVVNLRGHSLEDVMRECSFSEGVYLTVFGRLPKQSERRLLDALLNSLLDHGFVASTITAARYIASGNPQFIPAVAGGLLACGSNTVSPQHSFELIARASNARAARGVSVEKAAEEIVDEYIAQRKRIPGFGHPTHKTGDFRADVLFEIVEQDGLDGDGIKQYREIHRQFVRKTGRDNLPINIDGAMAAIGVDFGWTATQTVALAVMSVLPGVMAHVIEEIDTARPLRHITDGTYDGDELSPLSTREETQQ